LEIGGRSGGAGASDGSGRRNASRLGWVVNTETLFSSASDRWSTPPDVFAALDAEFAFNLDPCPLDGRVDGLSLFCDWSGLRVFCNPPYGPGVADWLRRAGEAELAVFLLPARTDVRWFHDLVLGYAMEVRFIRGRLKFGGSRNSAPFPSMVVIYRSAEPGEPAGC